MKTQQRYQLTLIFLLGLAIGHQFLQKGFGISIPFLHCYLDDFLAMPLLLAIWRWERNWWWRIPKLKKRDIFFFNLMMILVFELTLPSYSPAYTSDWADGLAYGMGSVLFWQFQP